MTPFSESVAVDKQTYGPHNDKHYNLNHQP